VEAESATGLKSRPIRLSDSKNLRFRSGSAIASLFEAISISPPASSFDLNKVFL
jgi:hypothetical protein